LVFDFAATNRACGTAADELRLVLYGLQVKHIPGIWDEA